MYSLQQVPTLSGRSTSTRPDCSSRTPLRNEQKKKITKVFSHRAAYKGVVLLLLTLITTLLLFVGGIYIPFDFAPYKNDLMKEMIPTSDFEDAVHWARKRILSVFMMPIGGGLSVTVLTIIHIWAMLRRGERFRTTVVASIATLFWTLFVAIWCGFVAFDLYSYPRDFLGLTDSWGEGYLQMLRQFAATGKSMNQSRDLHQMHKCCGIFGFDDFFTDRSIGKGMGFPWPKQVNATHLEVVPETCCAKGSLCHQQPIGQPVNTSRMYTTGCLAVFRFPLLTLSMWMTFNACLSLLFCVAAFLLMYWERRKLNTRRETKKRKYTTEKDSASFF